MSDMDGQAQLCRCEGVSVGAVRDAIAEGNLTINDVKRRTRAGMGICQGIFCVDAIAGLLAGAGVPPAEIERMTARPTARLISLAALAGSASPAASDRSE